MTRYGGWGPRVAPQIQTTVQPLDTRGPKRLWDHPGGFVVRERGAVGAVSTNVYECPVHGRFEARCDADSVACPYECEAPDPPLPEELPDRWVPCCGQLSHWVPSTFAAWQAAGEVKS